MKEQEFGIDPETIGYRYRDHWVIKDIEVEEEHAGASIGDLCVRTRDNGIGEIDEDATNLPNFVGTADDSFDESYLYYYFHPLKEPQ